ncbi:MAG: hypothetical protein WD207_07540 [Xanthobacteraceae bacterium]
MSKADFARLISKDEREARRILDPRHPTKLPTLAKALSVLGKRLVVTVEDLPSTARAVRSRTGRNRSRKAFESRMVQ